jgi:pimeloyl-ACP methyl ester carboxylesterase
MPTASVDGRELHYVQRGEGEPLLLIMGMSGNHLHWGEPFLELLARDFALTAYDHRGVGFSARADDPFTIADLASDAIGLMDAIGLESAHVMGISMGGMIAQEIALRSPERVRTLTLGCTYSGGDGSALTSPEIAQRLGAGIMSGDRERAIRTMFEVNLSPAHCGTDGAWEAFREVALENPAALPVIMAQMQAIAGHDTSARLAEITAPTLVIHGDLDEMLPVENGRMVARLIPGARLQTLEGIGHMFFWEEPERSAQLVREHALAAAAQ